MQIKLFIIIHLLVFLIPLITFINETGSVACWEIWNENKLFHHSFLLHFLLFLLCNDDVHHILRSYTMLLFVIRWLTNFFFIREIVLHLPTSSLSLLYGKCKFFHIFSRAFLKVILEEWKKRCKVISKIHSIRDKSSQLYDAKYKHKQSSCMRV